MIFTNKNAKYDFFLRSKTIDILIPEEVESNAELFVGNVRITIFYLTPIEW